MIKFNVLNRLSGAVQFVAEIDCPEDSPRSLKLGLAVKWAIKSKANLSRANLSRANLSRANLYGADLSDADLYGANLYGANLYGANLSRAHLYGADLYRADLSGAHLSDANLSDANLSRAHLYGANLSDANLSGANLSRANLSRANLSRANLYGADLYGANLRAFESDLWMTLTQNRNEVAGVIAALRAGKVDGSTYSGECACLVGTIANVRHADVLTLDRDSERPAERWFAMIRKGDKPGDATGGGFAAAKALEWCLEWQRANGIEPSEQAGA